MDNVITDLEEQTRHCASEALSELALASLRADDCLVVATVNATYSFLVVDPARNRGILTGGVLGANSVTAVLLGGEIRKGGQVSALLSKLCEGSRAIFFVATSDCVQQLITSTIVRLVRTRIDTGPVADGIKA